jgi:MFS family permease
MVTAQQVGASASPAKRRVGLGALSFIALLSRLEGALLGVLIPTVIVALRPTANQVLWIGEGGQLAYAAALVPVALLGDRYGRRRVVGVGLVLFAAGCVASALVSTPDGLIVTRAIVGAGSGALAASSLSLLPFVYPDAALRRRAVGIFQGFGITSSVVAPVLAGWVLQNYWWGAAFVMVLPACLLAAPLLWVIPPGRTSTVAARFDVLGLFLVFAATTTLVWTMIEGPRDGWSSTTFLGGLLVFALLSWGFMAWERRTATPWIRLEVITERGCLALLILDVAVSFVAYGAAYLLSQEFEFVEGVDSLGVGLRVAPFAAAAALAAVLTGLIANRFSLRAWVCMSAGWTIAGCLILTQPSGAVYWPIGVGYAVVGFGLGISATVLVNHLLSRFRTEESGVAAGTSGTVGFAGGAVGIAAIGSIVTSAYRHRLDRVFSHGGLAQLRLPAPARAAITDQIGGASAVARATPQPVSGLIGAQADTAFVSATQMAFAWGALVTGCLAALALLLLRDSSAITTAFYHSGPAAMREFESRHRGPSPRV